MMRLAVHIGKTTRAFPRAAARRVAMVLLAALLVVAQATRVVAAPRYNVLLILIDDCAPDLVSVTEQRHVKTPNLKRLAQRGVYFTRAYAAVPACAPSRASLLTGLAPFVSGVYHNDQSFRQAANWVRDVATLPQHFKANGYLAAGYGKIFHHGKQTEENRAVWTEGYSSPFVVADDLALGAQVAPAARIVGSDADPYWTWGPLPDTYDRDDPARMQQDTRHANLAIDLLSRKHDQPFFCALGFWKPHVNWYVPQRYYDLYPRETIPEPAGLKWDDLDDLPPAGRWFAPSRVFTDIAQRGYWKDALRAKMAAITYVDEQIGRVLDALERGPHARNTIVILAGDNGWHTGQKNHFTKFALWELACRVPLIISAPGFQATGQTTGARICATPVSLLDLYPTLTELCQLPQPVTHKLGGVSLAPLLCGAAGGSGRPVISTMGKDNHALRTARYRYIKYSNGDEELYDHAQDPHEWHNLAAASRPPTALTELRRHLPQVNAPDVYETGSSKRWEEVRRLQPRRGSDK